MLTDIMEEDEGEKNSSGGSGHRSPNRRNMYATGGTVKSSISHSLKTSIDFIKTLPEDQQHELNISQRNGGGGGGSLFNDSSSSLHSSNPNLVEHLTSWTLRISSSLKPSQRREKLPRLATELESNNKLANAHPI